ncbi:MAG: ABC transporter ATP-binding protein [Acidobacteria bacterium]|nr:MAG: ABC transporter ATP-binding protein [Acidobacteriota bacterium]
MAGGLLCLVLTTAFSVASPWVLRYAIDDLTLGVTREKLWTYSGFIVGIVLIEGVFRYYMRIVLISISRDIEYELRGDLFAHLTLLSPRYFQSHRIGDIMSRATNDMSAVRNVLGPGIMYTANTVATFVGTVVLMMRISPRLLGLALVPLVLVSILVRHFGRRIHDRFEAVQAQLSEMNVIVQESLSGVRVVRAYAQEPHEVARFEQANREYVRRNRGLIRMFGSLYPGIQLLMGTGAVLVVWLGGRMAVAGRITIGEFVAFGVYLAMLHWPMIALGWVVNIFERGEASMGRIAEILEAPPDIRDEDPEPVRALRGDVEFRDLTFSYDGKPVLQHVDLEVPAGSTVAIVGPTGSGKSTLVSLVPRLFQAPPGTVFVDGHDVRRIPLAVLRAAVGFVPQETFLFSDTVRENVAFGLRAEATSSASGGIDSRRERGGSGGGDAAPPGIIDDEDEIKRRVEWAAGVAQLARDVAEFPQGYDTFVGERGITLSGGQKQRAALARALAVQPRILVLDDALSAVDTYTEEEILKGLKTVRAGCTTFLVSHRISTVKDADLIVVLREGTIVERGTHDELVARRGFYADLHRRQLLEEEVERTA